MNNEYIDLNDFINKINYYQFHLNNEKLNFELVGSGKKIGDIIIQNNFGKNKDYTICSCIYTNEEIQNIQNKYIPLIKIYNQHNSYSIGFISKELLNFNKNQLNNFDIYFVYLTDSCHKIKLEKNINDDNIIEKLMENMIDLNIELL